MQEYWNYIILKIEGTNNYAGFKENSVLITWSVTTDNFSHLFQIPLLKVEEM